MRVSLLALLALIAGGCRHVTTVSNAPGTADGGQPAPQPSADDNRSQRPTHLSARQEPAGPGRPPLATSPEGLMLPDGPRIIQKALADRGYLREAPTGKFDGQTRKALQRFQAEHDLPGTGAPDHATVRKLGLNPKEIFRPPKE